ncbi:MAG: hypothetical protein V4857_12840 [Pseudomonadota bacterium]
MRTQNKPLEIAVIKDNKKQGPIPSVWRPVLTQIVKSFVRHDYLLSAGIPGVATVSAETAEQIQEYIEEYGERLIELPEEAWDTSVCIWLGDRWNALIDLWTEAEGSSDLVLSVHITEAESGYLVDLYMVYVP